jgi:hypothetical protein
LAAATATTPIEMPIADFSEKTSVLAPIGGPVLGKNSRDLSGTEKRRERGFLPYTLTLDRA